MSKISIVIPTYNRYANLYLAVWALKCQTNQDFELIIADDGGADATHDIVRSAVEWGMDAKYYWHADEGYRVSLTRNQGTRISKGTHILYIDSDVMLNKHAIEHYYDLISKHPDCVIAGRYDWLPPMKIEASDIENRWDDIVNHRLQRLAVGAQGHVGADHRKVDWQNEEPTDKLSCLSGNLLIPRHAFEKTGGFDENIEDRGQDGEFTRALKKAGYKNIYSQRVIGYHVSHERDQKWETESVIRTIKYIHKKYGLKLKEEHLPKVEDYE